MGVAQAALGDGIAVWTIALPLVALLAWATRLRRAALVVALGVACWPVATALLGRAALLQAPLW
ncbi:MAG TPA: hypothetical protein VFS05_04180, partial [Gemmatimonadaceae bacterium]|nr:hypothetical protein [Gemmatimonadaceae bacterium]